MSHKEIIECNINRTKRFMKTLEGQFAVKCNYYYVGKISK